jgi:uncharacterized protein
MVAANHSGTTDVVRQLLDAGAKVRFGRPAFAVPTPVFLSTSTAEPEKTKLLIAAGDDVRQPWLRYSIQKYTTLGNAVDMGDADLVRIIAKAGADVNEHANNKGVTPLEQAVLSNFPEVVTALLQSGADVNLPDEMGMTPILYAAMSDYGDTEVARRLIDAGAKLDWKNNDGLTARDAARKFHYTGLLAVLEGPRAAQP